MGSLVCFLCRATLLQALGRVGLSCLAFQHVSLLLAWPTELKDRINLLCLKAVVMEGWDSSPSL